MSVSTLHNTNFPLYTVSVLDKDHFVVAGGGGSAKTGVPNALVRCHFLIWLLDNKYHRFKMSNNTLIPPPLPTDTHANIPLITLHT